MSENKDLHNEEVVSNEENNNVENTNPTEKADKVSEEKTAE